MKIVWELINLYYLLFINRNLHIFLHKEHYFKLFSDKLGAHVIFRIWESNWSSSDLHLDGLVEGVFDSCIRLNMFDCMNYICISPHVYDVTPCVCPSSIFCWIGKPNDNGDTTTVFPWSWREFSVSLQFFSSVLYTAAQIRASQSNRTNVMMMMMMTMFDVWLSVHSSFVCIFAFAFWEKGDPMYNVFVWI